MRPVTRIKRSRPRIRRTDLVHARLLRAFRDACSGYVGDVTAAAGNIIVDYVRNQIVALPSLRHRIISVELVDERSDENSVLVDVTIS